MKKYILPALLCFFLKAGASTTITLAAANQSDAHWTMANSPYIIQTNVWTLGSTRLTIDSGVEVVFDGPYNIDIQGYLMAKGTAAHPILFHAADTTGFSTDTGSIGGWQGIVLESGLGDSLSQFEYCDVRDMKNGSFAFEWRNMTMRNCNFYHNYNTGVSLGGCIVSGINYGSMSVENCSFHDNWGGGGILGLDEDWDYHVTGCSVYNNICGSALSAIVSTGVIEGNEIYNNTCAATGSALFVIGDSVRIAHNKIHHNTSQNEAAIDCGQGVFVDIDDNLICNNVLTDGGSCGASDGGAGIHLTDAPAVYQPYIVRNNIIANNYSTYSDAGIYCIFSDAVITNNTFYNNLAPGSTNDIYIGYFDTFHVVIKNNIFYHDSDESAGSVTVVSVTSGTLDYGHNWAQHSFASEVGGINFNFTSDTATNITGANPFLAAPTTVAGLLGNALSADFSLTGRSACINRGDSSGACTDSTDYAGNARVYGGRIDIGAYEYQRPAGTAAATVLPQQMSVYPNPAAGALFAETPSANGAIELRDMAGRQLLRQDVTGQLTSLDVHSVARGLYLLIWQNANGQELVKKVTIE